MRALEADTDDSNADAEATSASAATATITAARARTTEVKQAAPGRTGRGPEPMRRLALDLRERRRCVLRLRERARLDGDRCGLRRDRDLFTGGRVAAGPLGGRGTHAHVELDDTADLDLLCVPDLVEDDLFECGKRLLRVGARETGLLGDGVSELRLRHWHGNLLDLLVSALDSSAQTGRRRGRTR